MPELLFQEEICAFINKVSLDSCPKSIAFVGDDGCGKKTAVKLLSEKLHVPMFDITDKINFETISEIYNNPKPSVYLIDANLISDKEQNEILKIAEEPPVASYIVISCRDGVLIPTLENRCQTLKFKPYDRSFLMSFTDGKSNIVTELFSTPGQIIKYRDFDLSEYDSLIGTMFERFDKANISNILTISNKFKFDSKSDSDKDKLDLSLFSVLLLKRIADRSKDGMNLSDLYSIVSGFVKDQKIPNINKKFLTDSFLISLKLSRCAWR